MEMAFSLLLVFQLLSIGLCMENVQNAANLTAADLIERANLMVNRTNDMVWKPPVVTLPGVAHAVITSGRTDYKWPNAELLYKITGSFNRGEKATIEQSMAEISRVSCIKFREVSSARAYVKIVSGNGCYSYIGRLGRAQDLSLGNNCVHKGIVIHELLHALGFYHEQNRRDRNSYVRILTQNIVQGQERNFEMVAASRIDHLGVPYDKKSVMHYSKYSFSKNRQPTIVSLGGENEKLGGKKLTPNDITRLNKLYCGGATVKPTKETPRTPRPTGVVVTPRPTGVTPKPPVSGGCSDRMLFCVKFYGWSSWRKRRACQRHSRTCPFACGTCSPGSTQERCRNFDDARSMPEVREQMVWRMGGSVRGMSCAQLVIRGNCRSRWIGSRVRMMCSKSCCESGQLYGRARRMDDQGEEEVL